MSKMKITASEIKQLLAVKHASDVFVPECKNGPTHGAARLLKLDGWAMKRSWSNPQTIGYEIKVSRSDFLGDDKWTAYLSYCSHFYFVTPPGLIKADELPPNVGHLVVTKNKTKLLTKKKAPPREVEIPENLFRYVLMCRAEIGKEQGQEGYWNGWLEDRDINANLGRKVSKTLSKEISDRVIRVQDENRELKRDIEKLSEVKRLCDKIGIVPSLYLSESRFEDKIRPKSETLPVNILRMIDRLSESVESLKSEVNRKRVIK